MSVRSGSTWIDQITLDNVLRLNNMAKILTHFDEQKPDEFGCRICEHALLNIEKQFRTNEFSVRFRRLQTDGDTWLHSIEEFKKIKNVIPIANSAFSKDQYGISNQSRPDGVFVIEVCTANGHCRKKVPVFVEVDTGNEHKFRNQSRIIAMKMWQSVAVGQWIEKSSTVVTLRMETQQISKNLVQKVRKGRGELTSQTLIVQHLRDLLGACTEILHAVTLACVFAQFDLKKKVSLFYNKNFFEHLFDSMKGNECRDFHFFVGPFSFDFFDLDTERMATPIYVGKELDKGTQKSTNLYTNERVEEVFKNVNDPKQYFNKSKSTVVQEPCFYEFTGARQDADKTARFVGDFWDNQMDWKCSMQYKRKEYDKDTSILTTTELIHSRIPMHCINVKRTNIDNFKVPHLEKMKNKITVQGVRIPDNMFYIEDILKVLDRFIYQAAIDALKDDYIKETRLGNLNELQKTENVLKFIMEKTFKFTPLIRIPPSLSYNEPATHMNESDYASHFFAWSGFHLFIEPFISVMENTLFSITSDATESTDDFQNFGREITEFKRNITRNEFQLDMNRHRVEFPRASEKGTNLALRCLLSYDNDNIDPDLQKYLYDKNISHSRTLNNEYLVLVCKWLKCYDKPSLSALVRHYMTNEIVRSSINAKLAGVSEGIRSEILYMFEVIYTDTMFLFKKREDENSKATVLAFDDDDLEHGTLKMSVRVHWLPYELYVNFERTAWRDEALYDFSTKQWINIDTSMDKTTFAAVETTKLKNRVQKVFGFDNVNILTYPAMYGACLWKKDDGVGSLFDTANIPWRDRTRLLRALSLTNLKLSDWQEIQSKNELISRCNKNPNLYTLKDEVNDYINHIGEFSDTEKSEIENILRVPFEKSKGVWKDESFIRRLCRCKVDCTVLIKREGEGTISDYFQSCEDTPYPVYENYNYKRLREDLKGNYTTTRIPWEERIQNWDSQDMKWEYGKDDKKYDRDSLRQNNNLNDMCYQAVSHLNLRLSDKDIVLHEALGTYFGMSYKHKKCAQFHLFIYERFHIFKKRFVPYQRWMMQNRNKTLMEDSIFNEVMTVRRYQAKNSIKIFSDEDFKIAQDNSHGDCLKLQIKIRSFLFQNNQVLFRFMHMMWTWKWFMIKLSCIHDYREWFVNLQGLEDRLMRNDEEAE